jgi:hypothetical protein
MASASSAIEQILLELLAHHNEPVDVLSQVRGWSTNVDLYLARFEPIVMDALRANFRQAQEESLALHARALLVSFLTDFLAKPMRKLPLERAIAEYVRRKAKRLDAVLN